MKILIKNMVLRKEKLFLYLFLVITSLIFVYSASIGEYAGFLNGKGNGALHFFYEMMDSGIKIWIFILCILVVPNLCAVEQLIDKNSNFSSFLKVRLGCEKYMWAQYSCNFIISCVAILVFQLIILLFIHFFLSPIRFDTSGIGDIDTMTRSFSSNELISIIPFLLFTSIGYGIFSCFIMSLQRFVRNVYVFRILGVIVGLVLYTGIILVSNLLSFLPFLENIVSRFYMAYLINPGVFSAISIYHVNTYFSFLITAVLYSIISFCLYRSLIKRERTYD